MSEFSAVDISKFPFPEMVQVLSHEEEFQKLKANLLELVPAAAEELELETEPMTIFLQRVASEIVKIKGQVNDDSRKNTLAHSYGAALENFAFNLGVLKEEAESDDSLKRRAILAQEKRTTAGHRGMYIAHALDAAPTEVKGVEAIKVNNDGLCRIYVLANEGSGIPNAELIATVHDYVLPRIPLCSSLETQSAEVLEYSIAGELKFYPGVDRAAALTDCQARAEAFAEKRRALGYDITLHGIQGAFADPRIQNAIITAPADDIVCADHQAAYCTGVVLTDGGHAL